MKTRTKISAFQKVVGPALFLIPCLTWTMVSVAQELDEEPVATTKESLSLPNTELSHQSSWSANVLYSHVTYSEPGLMSESGALAGVGFSYNRLFRDNPMVLRFEGEYLFGQLVYVGQTWTGTPMTATTTDNILNGRALLGLQTRVNDQLSVSPFLGFGARYLNDLIQSGYDREITYFYAPIGVNFSLDLAHRWALSCGGEYDYFIRGNVVSHLDQIGPQYPTTAATQNSGYGYRLTAGIEHDFISGWALKISPYLHYWNVQQSTTQTFALNNSVATAWEPKNTSTMYGVNASFKF